MNFSRRSVLAAGVGVPLAVATNVDVNGSGAVPLAGAVPRDPSEFRLTRRLHPSRGDGTAYADTVDELAGALETVSVRDVLADTGGLRTGTRIGPADGAGIADGWVSGFGWQGHGAGGGRKADSVVRGWRPQGITSDHDAHGGRLRTLLVSWHDRGGKVDKGMRVSVVRWSGKAEPVYRHVLLAEPYRDAAGRATFAPIRRHAGGIAWYGDLLYVVDTWGGLRVFDLRRLLRVRGGARDDVGLREAESGDDEPGHSAFGYAYVLPQIAAYDNSGLAFRYTAVSVDRTSVPHSLLVCEYTEDTGRRPRVMRLPAVPERGALPRRLGAGEVHGVTTIRTRDDEVIGRRRIQGVAGVRETYFFSVSAGDSRKGKLCTWTPGAARPARLGGLTRGPEDLSYDGTANVLWTVGEYHADRYVYAVTPTRNGRARNTA